MTTGLLFRRPQVVVFVRPEPDHYPYGTVQRDWRFGEWCSVRYVYGLFIYFDQRNFCPDAVW